ncbi:MAG: protein translocase subunit SecF [Nitrospirae bacterium]|nr:protein translocase subunit SecF [Nitrospirota bacterium]
MIEIIKKTNINFMGFRNYAFTFSGILMLLGVIAIIQVARGSANLGIDFAGGTEVQVKFDHSVTLQQVRKVIDNAGIKDFELQDLPTVNKVLIQIKGKEDTVGQYSDKIVTALKEGFKDYKIDIDSISEIGPKVGSRLRVDAMWAIIAASIGILVYVTWRFKFRFSVGATIATFHDVLAVLGIFYIMGAEINLILLSALLTIAGYSLTDTVVVFDRIRENLGLINKYSIIEIVNRSINEVFSRTIVTSLTVFLSGVSLFIFGGEILHGFATAILMGVIIGTYSSVFVATPIVLLFGGGEKIVKRK